MASPTQITPNQLLKLIGTPACPQIVDVCLEEDLEPDPRLIPSSFRHPHDRIESLVDGLSGKKAVVVCQKGLKLSQGAAAILRANGIEAETLVGGQMAWREAGFPSIREAKIPKRDKRGRTVWVTRHRPKIDRIACPWLIRRFVDPSALFLFVEPGQVENVAERFHATPFDIEQAYWSHRGERCTFDTMLEEFGLDSEALDRLATIVRGADTNRHDLAPEAAGLLALSLGLSRMYKDDLEQLQAGLTFYDALYRWSRDATDEGHDWPATTFRDAP